MAFWPSNKILVACADVTTGGADACAGCSGAGCGVHADAAADDMEKDMDADGEEGDTEEEFLDNVDEE